MKSNVQSSRKTKKTTLGRTHQPPTRTRRQIQDPMRVHHHHPSLPCKTCCMCWTASKICAKICCTQCLPVPFIEAFPNKSRNQSGTRKWKPRWNGGTKLMVQGYRRGRNMHGQAIQSGVIDKILTSINLGVRNGQQQNVQSIDIMASIHKGHREYWAGIVRADSPVEKQCLHTTALPKCLIWKGLGNWVFHGCWTRIWHWLCKSSFS